ncbi:MAG: AhpA/YtjB family protein [Pseudomonadota bacterium]
MIKRIINSSLQPLFRADTQTRAWLRLIAKRLLRLAMAAALLLIIFNVWNIASLQSQQQLKEHTRQLINLTLAQVAHQSVNSIKAQDMEQLQASTDHLQSLPAVVSVVVRSSLGEQLVTSGAPVSVIDWPAEAKPKPWIITRELNGNGPVTGYLQVIFDKQQVLATSQSAHQGLMQQGRVLLLLAMLAGVFIMLGFNRIRDRFWQPVTKD